MNTTESQAPTSSIRVTAIIVVRNGERYLAEALRSVEAQTRPADEIIVVDGHSTDNTVAIAQSFAAVTCLQQPATGIADARNHGIAVATGNVIAFLDHDDRWLPNKLEIQLDQLLRNPELCYTTTMVRWFREGDHPHHHLYGPDRFGFGEAGQMPTTLVARREVFEFVGNFDPSLTIACDQDWFVRAADMGVKTATIPQVLLEKRLHGHNASAHIALLKSEWFRVLRRSIARKRQLSVASHT